MNTLSHVNKVKTNKLGSTNKQTNKQQTNQDGQVSFVVNTHSHVNKQKLKAKTDRNIISHPHTMSGPL